MSDSLSMSLNPSPSGTPPLASNPTQSPLIVYVSLPPDSIPSGVRAVIRHPASGFTITEVLREGALDPVPVPAQPGDVVEVDVYDEAGAMTTFSAPVFANGRPRVVRTIPPKGKVDVPLNGTVRVVFSEPVAPATLTSNGITLFRGDLPVTGRLAFVDDEHLAVAFIPSAPLTANRGYRLVVDANVRDLDGESLGRPVSTSFTTGTRIDSDLVASIAVSPNPATVIVGQAVRFSLIAKDARGRVLGSPAAVWQSSAPGVAYFLTPAEDSLAINGLALASRPGPATVSATINGITASAALTVLTGPQDTAVKVADLVLAPASKTVGVDDQFLIRATVFDASGQELTSGRWIEWTSDNPAVATVTQSSQCGVCLEMRVQGVRALSEGSARIIAATEGVADTAVITVGPRRAVARVEITPASQTLLLREKMTLTPRMWDANGQEIIHRLVTWTNDNSASVKTADGTGYEGAITAEAVAVGTANLSATVEGVSAAAVITVPLLTFKSISAGGEEEFPEDVDRPILEHTCGVTVSGAAFCWGGSDRGQLGVYFVGSAVNYRSVPMAVPGGVQYAAVSAGIGTSCGLDMSGKVFCWGQYHGTTSGAVRLSSMEMVTYDPCGLTAEGKAYCMFGGEGALAPAFTFTALAIGYTHDCGLVASGEAFCWGLNDFGELGDETTTTATSDAPVRVKGAPPFVALAVGYQHSCGLTAAGAAYCWGANTDGALGDGTTTHRSLPVLVSGSLTFASLSLGRATSSSCGITTAGNAYCWGQNTWGQLGDGSTTARLVPTAVAGGLRFSSISIGEVHACGVTTDAVAYCWGSNRNGAVGVDVNTANTRVPVKVTGQP